MRDSPHSPDLQVSLLILNLTLSVDTLLLLLVSDPRVYIICVDSRPRLQSCGAHDEFDRYRQGQRKSHISLSLYDVERIYRVLCIITNNLNVSGRV